MRWCQGSDVVALAHHVIAAVGCAGIAESDPSTRCMSARVVVYGLCLCVFCERMRVRFARSLQRIPSDVHAHRADYRHFFWQLRCQCSSARLSTMLVPCCNWCSPRHPQPLRCLAFQPTMHSRIHTNTSCAPQIYRNHVFNDLGFGDLVLSLLSGGCSGVTEVRVTRASVATSTECECVCKCDTENMLRIE